MASSFLAACAAKDLNTAESRTAYHFELSLFAQFISLIYAQRRQLDQVSDVKLASKRVQLF